MVQPEKEEIDLPEMRVSHDRIAGQIMDMCPAFRTSDRVSDPHFVPKKAVLVNPLPRISYPLLFYQGIEGF